MDSSVEITNAGLVTAEGELIKQPHSDTVNTAGDRVQGQDVCLICTWSTTCSPVLQKDGKKANSDPITQQAG